MNILYDLLLFAPFFAALFWAIILFVNRKENCRQQNIWLVWLSVVCVNSLTWILLFSGIEDYETYCKFDIVDITLVLVFFPLIYFYFRSLTHRRRFSWKEYVWLAPAVLIGAASAFLYYLMGSARSAVVLRELVELQDVKYAPWSLEWMLKLVSLDLMTAVLVIQIVVVMVYSSLNLIKYKKGLANFFSNLDEKSIRENRAVLTCILILIGVAFVAIAMWEVYPEQYYFVGYALMAFMGTAIFYMSYHVSRITLTEADLVGVTVGAEAEHVSPAALHETCVKIFPALVELFDGDRVFLQPNLSLNDVALRLNTDRVYVSRIINTEFECSFYEFVNSKRIAFAQDLITRSPGLSQEQTAEMSGFASVATFVRVFRNQTGETFSQWRRTAHVRV